MPVLSVILPVGISFYTFEAINYTVDVYRRKIRAERDLGHFLLFILFFPHLVAGPIVRAKDFLPQIRRRKHWDWARIHLGMQFILMGLFKKLAVADHLAQYADPIFADPTLYRTSAIWMGVLAYAIQIYCDFSGYTDMAIGCAHLLGYRLAKNFNLPYLAVNVSDFWRRWHISLSSWLRDYLFIPLGGSRGNGVADLPQSVHHDGARRLVARRQLAFSPLGLLPRRTVGYPSILPTIHRFARFAELIPAIHSRHDLPCSVNLRRRQRRLGALPRIVARGRRHDLWPHGRAVRRQDESTSGAQSVDSHRCLGRGACVGRDRIVETALTAASCAALGAAYAVALNLALVLAPDAGKTFIYFQF